MQYNKARYLDFCFRLIVRVEVCSPVGTSDILVAQSVAECRVEASSLHCGHSHSDDKRGEERKIRDARREKCNWSRVKSRGEVRIKNEDRAKEMRIG